MASAVVNRAHGAVLALCADAPLVNRLSDAYRALAEIDPAAVPVESQARFAELVADITYGADTVPDALAQMSAADRVVLAGRMVAFYGEMRAHLGAEA